MYQTPVKRIITKEHLEQFIQSEAYLTYIDYIVRLNDSVCDLKIDSDVHVSPVSKLMHPMSHKSYTTILTQSIECQPYPQLA